jgi:hypothetical protein
MCISYSHLAFYYQASGFTCFCSLTAHSSNLARRPSTLRIADKMCFAEVNISTTKIHARKIFVKAFVNDRGVGAEYAESATLYTPTLIRAV